MGRNILKKHGKLKKSILGSQKTAKYSTRLCTFNSFAVLLSYDNLVILNFFLLDLMLKGTILCHQPIWSSFHKTVFLVFVYNSFSVILLEFLRKSYGKKFFLIWKTLEKSNVFVNSHVSSHIFLITWNSCLNNYLSNLYIQGERETFVYVFQNRCS